VLLLLNVWTTRSQSSRSVWDGVYTEEQAARGETVFKTSCAACHAPADFTGDTFLGTWDASTAQDLFSVIQKSMPMDNPGSLPPQNYADVVAYIFRTNAFPAGKDELTTAADQLKLIRIEQKK
jgi:S-disulfanyl-L-cysteine oxidoreductase SoxD